VWIPKNTFLKPGEGALREKRKAELSTKRIKKDQDYLGKGEEVGTYRRRRPRGQGVG